MLLYLILDNLSALNKMLQGALNKG